MYTLHIDNISPLCIPCTLIPQMISPLTLTLVRTWYEESTPMIAVWLLCHKQINAILSHMRNMLNIGTMTMKFWKFSDFDLGTTQCHALPIMFARCFLFPYIIIDNEILIDCQASFYEMLSSN